MILKTLVLDAKNEISYNNRELLIELGGSPIMNIELLEIVCSNPSNLSIWVGDQTDVTDIASVNWKVIPLFRFRTEMLFQSNIFILDTKNIEQLQVNIQKAYRIKAKSSNESEEFIITLYCSANKQDLMKPEIEYA